MLGESGRVWPIPLHNPTTMSFQDDLQQNVATHRWVSIKLLNAVAYRKVIVVSVTNYYSFCAQIVISV